MTTRRWKKSEKFESKYRAKDEMFENGCLRCGQGIGEHTCWRRGIQSKPALAKVQK